MSAFFFSPLPELFLLLFLPAWRQLISTRLASVSGDKKGFVGCTFVLQTTCRRQRFSLITFHSPHLDGRLEARRFPSSLKTRLTAQYVLASMWQPHREAVPFWACPLSPLQLGQPIPPGFQIHAGRVCLLRPLSAGDRRKQGDAGAAIRRKWRGMGGQVPRSKACNVCIKCLNRRILIAAFRTLPNLLPIPTLSSPAVTTR